MAEKAAGRLPGFHPGAASARGRFIIGSQTYHQVQAKLSSKPDEEDEEPERPPVGFSGNVTYLMYSVVYVVTQRQWVGSQLYTRVENTEKISICMGIYIHEVKIFGASWGRDPVVEAFL